LDKRFLIFEFGILIAGKQLSKRLRAADLQFGHKKKV